MLKKQLEVELSNDELPASVRALEEGALLVQDPAQIIEGKMCNI